MKDERAVMKKRIKGLQECARYLKECKVLPQSIKGTGWSTKTRSKAETKIKELEAEVEELLKLLRQYSNDASS